ncbi:MAG TPA: hypothetical protein VGH54_09725 [Mycobacterium sp.]|jgi:hypothetical protein|uniref:hypothetical protein n=1 Tax=Mycobacterium sp. TaxID=1785 RepID=UPI002F42E7CB
MKKITIAAITATAAVAGGWIAIAVTDNNATDAATYATSHPAVTPTPAPTVTTTTTVVPQSCLDALDDADTVIGTSAQAVSIMADAFGAAANLDTAGIQAATEKLNALNPTLSAQGETYKTAREACKAAQ